MRFYQKCEKVRNFFIKSYFMYLTDNLYFVFYTD